MEKPITRKLIMDYYFGSKPKNKKIENPMDQDEKRSIEEIISSICFHFKKHLIKTGDGYILVLFSKPWAEKIQRRLKTSPVLLQHGVFY